MKNENGHSICPNCSEPILIMQNYHISDKIEEVSKPPVCPECQTPLVITEDFEVKTVAEVQARFDGTYVEPTK